MKKLIIFFTMLIVILSLSKYETFAQFNTRDTVSIPASDSLSYTFDLTHNKLAAIEFPATFQGSTVSIWTAIHPDSTFHLVQYDGSDISVTATDGKQCGIKPVEANQLLRYVKFKSDSTESAIRLLRIIKTSF